MPYIEWLRGVIGSRKTFLVFSSVVLQDPHGRVLLQRRTDFDLWGLPGGVLEIEEDVISCARRELMEETGLSAGRLHPCGIYTHPKYDVIYPNQDQVQQCTICFRGQVNGGKMQPDGIETSEQAFFETARLGEVAMSGWYRDMIYDALYGDAIVFTPPYSIEHPIAQVETIRPLVGHDRIIVVEASVLVMNKEGQFLGLRRPETDCWRLPMGPSKLGENVAQTAVRVVFEATGMHVIPSRVVGIYSDPEFHRSLANGDQIKPVGPLFLAHLAPSVGRLQSTGKSVLKWMRLEEFAERACKPDGILLELAMPHWQSGHFVR